MPAQSRRNVLLPQPLAPTTAAICPDRTVRSTSDNTTRLPYFFVIPTASSSTRPPRRGTRPTLSTTAAA